MAVNPNPSRITDPMWRLWEESTAIIPGVRLGGIFANKPCYHNTVAANKLNWPDAYCIKLSLDLQGPTDKARAIDWTMSTAEMIKRTRYLIEAADRNDPRLASVREFYGTLNGETVVGRIKDSRTGVWRWSTADDTHLWHIHMSIFTAYVNDWNELAPILSVLRGESLGAWQTGSIMFCKYGDSGEHVRYLQYRLKNVNATISQIVGTVDGDYGDKTAAGLAALVKLHNGSTVDGKTFGAAQAIYLDWQWHKKFTAGLTTDVEVAALDHRLDAAEGAIKSLQDAPSGGITLPATITLSGVLNPGA